MNISQLADKEFRRQQIIRRVERQNRQAERDELEKRLNRRMS